MDIQQIKNFLKLAQELHFWRTANSMNITQSALSRQIQALEEELGVRLFDRNKRNVKLTLAGEFLKDKWALLLDDLNHVHSFAKKIDLGETGSIRIAHPDSISYSLLPEMISAVADQYPGIQVELVQLLYENAQESLQNYRIDLAFTRQINTLTDISSVKIQTEPVALFVHADHAYQTCSDLTAENLAQQKFILPVAEHKSSYYFMVQDIFRSFNIEASSVYRSDFGSSILGLISRGLGIGILPLGFSKQGLHGIRAIALPFHTDLYINWRTNDQSQALQNTLDIVLKPHRLDERAAINY